MKRIAIFASGSGTNAQNIIEYFAHHKLVVVDSLWSNREDAYALIRAERLGVEALTFDQDTFYRSNDIIDELEERKIDLVVLAGFLWLVPSFLTELFPIINIHPALLPNYGGKGMYGMKVHQAVVANKDLVSGITIHRVNEKYDAGSIIFQAQCELSPNDTPEDVAAKVHQLEYEHYPRVIEEFLFRDDED